MRKTAYVVLAALCVLIAVAMSGCGKKEVAGIPGTVATVNGERISGPNYVSQVTRDAGAKSLSGMIEQRIILQWAKDEKVEPTDKQVQEQIDAVKRSGMYDDQVKALGEDGIKEAIRVRQATMNLEEKSKPTPDKTLESLYNANKANYVHGPQKFVQIIVNADSSKIDEAAKKLSIAPERRKQKVSICRMRSEPVVSPYFWRWLGAHRPPRVTAPWRPNLSSRSMPPGFLTAHGTRWRGRRCISPTAAWPAPRNI